MIAIQHISFTCKDKAVSETFYTRHFGFRRARVLNEGTPDEFVILRLGGACIELFQGSPDAGQAPEALPVGFKHLAFEVPDLDVKIAELNADGVETDDIMDCSGVVPDMRVCFFRDPDGNSLEIMENYCDDPAVTQL
jgi:glyoxylase I family protein